MEDITEIDLAKATGFDVTTLRRWKAGKSGESKKKLFEFLWKERKKFTRFVKK